MAYELLSTREAYGHDADLFETIREVGWQETPFFASIGSGAPRARSNAANGHQWQYMSIPDGDSNNAHIEGSAPAAADKFTLGNMTNHYQIFKDTFGVTGSEDATMTIDNKKELARQMAMSEIKHKKSIEIALLGSAAPVQRDAAGTVAGKLGGVKHFLTANTDTDVSAVALDWGIILEGLKPGFLEGVPMRCVMMNTTQKDKLDAILFNKSQNTNMSQTRIDNNVTIIGQTAYGNNIKVILNPFIGQDEILFYNPEYINAVAYRPTKVYDLPRTSDGVKKELITELTLRVDHEYAIRRIKNLKVS